MSGCVVLMMEEGGNGDVIHHGTSRDMLRGPSKVDMDGSDLQYIQEDTLDDGRNHDQKVDVDDRAHTYSVLHVHHDSVHVVVNGGEVHRRAQGEGGRTVEHSGEVVVDEEGVDDHELVGVQVEDEDHGDVEHDEGDDLVEEVVEQHEELGVVVEHVEEEQGDEQEVVQAKVHRCVYVVYVADDADENRDEHQVEADLLVEEMPIMDGDGEAVPLVHDQAASAVAYVFLGAFLVGHCQNLYLFKYQMYKCHLCKVRV